MVLWGFERVKGFESSFRVKSLDDEWGGVAGIRFLELFVRSEGDDATAPGESTPMESRAGQAAVPTESAPIL